MLVVAGLLLAVTPATVSHPVLLQEAVVLVGGLSAILVMNLFAVRRALAPLENLTAMMARIDRLRPGQRVPVDGNDKEIVELAEAFNAMLARLENERRESGRRTLAVQEEERLRVARELHDQVGQTLTAVLLQHQTLVREAPDAHREQLVGAREAVRGSLEDVRRIAADLRPGPLEDLGLSRAIDGLCDLIRETSDLAVELEIWRDLPQLDAETELVVYRIAQEALTNVARHAGATRAEVRVEPLDGGGVRLCVIDDGRGLRGASEGDGLRGMRERALLVGGRLAIADGTEGGTEVVLEVPAADARSADA